MARHFHWQPSEIDELPVEDLLADFEAARAFLEAEFKAR